ncbi:MAG: sporulation integral membrane protein YtvI, partial [Lachnospiraceae bacterium]|nr:sporulation integral membrane protein YtvI [Lachnospiraceae bacterium]
MESAKKYLRIFLNIGIPLTGIVLVCVLLPKVLGYFMPFVIGW